MYGKVFVQMYDGTLATEGPWQALVTFQQLIILADKEGVVDMTIEAIARRTTVPLNIISQGIEALEKPDPQSRTPDEEGKRIVRLSEVRPWGWRITNYGHYRAIRTADDRREYHRQYAQKRRFNEKVNTTQQKSTKSTRVNSTQPIVEANTEAKVKVETEAKKSSAVLGKPKRLSPKSFEDWLEEIQRIPPYEHIDCERELAKAQAWFITNRGNIKNFTKKFFLNWLNNVGPPMEKKKPPAMRVRAVYCAFPISPRCLNLIWPKDQSQRAQLEEKGWLCDDHKEVQAG